MKSSESGRRVRESRQHRRKHRPREAFTRTNFSRLPGSGEPGKSGLVASIPPFLHLLHSSRRNLVYHLPVHSLSYTTSGAGGHPVLFLHGFMGRSEDWEGISAGLGKGFRSIAVDLPGHGNSLGLPEEAYTMEGAANAAIRTLDELGIETASLAGYSMGGRLALYFALRFSERCERLFLESSSPGLKTEEERIVRRKADEEKAKRLETGDFEAFLEEWYRMPLFATLDDGVVKSLIEKRRGNAPSELAKSLRGMGTGSQPSLWEELENLRAPMLAVAGELDRKFVGIARGMAERSSRISIQITPGAGHNVRVEAPGEYSKLLGEFLEAGKLK